MENLTHKYGAVKPNVPPAPMEGYRVVVFEKQQGGNKFKTILNPGDTPVKKEFRFFSEAPDYICYAISNDPNLIFRFDMQLTLSALHQNFSLTCTVYYHLSSPKPMALAFETDPLQRIQEELKARLQENVLVSKIQMADIRENFYQIKDKILPYSTLNQIRDFAGEFGVIIKEINMTYQIPGKFLEPDLKIEEYELNRKTTFIEGEKKRIHQLSEIDDIMHESKKKDLVNIQDARNTLHQQQMENLKRFNQFQREIADHLNAGISKIINPIDNPESFKKAFDTTLDALKRVASEIQHQDGAIKENQLTGAPNEVKMLTATSPDSFDEANQRLSKIRVIVENTSIPPDDKKIIFSTLNHLQEEIQLEENADREMIEKYIGKLSDYINKYSKILTHDIVEQTRGFKEKVHQLFNRWPEISTGADGRDKSVAEI